MKQTDAELIKETLDGNTDSFGILVRRYQEAVYGLSYYIMGNFADAEDAAQEAFLSAYLNLSQLSESSKFAGWLRRITHNVCNMWMREQRKICIIDEGNASELEYIRDNHDPTLDLEKKELFDAILKAINSLSEGNRLVATLFYINELSYKQISYFLDLPITTIESRLHKSRKKLKKEIIQMLDQDFGIKRLGDEFSRKVIRGVIEINADPAVYGFIRQGEQRENDAYVSPSQITKFGLKTGDAIKGLARKPIIDKGEHYHAVLYIHSVNGKDPRSKSDVKSDENLVPENGNKVVEGVLELVPHLFGFINQQGSKKEDIYVGPSLIRNFGLKNGDIIEGEADFSADKYEVSRIDRVNNNDAKRSG